MRDMRKNTPVDVYAGEICPLEERDLTDKAASYIFDFFANVGKPWNRLCIDADRYSNGIW